MADGKMRIAYVVFVVIQRGDCQVKSNNPKMLNISDA